MTTDLGATAGRKWDLGGDAALSPMVSVAWEHVYQGTWTPSTPISAVRPAPSRLTARRWGRTVWLWAWA